MIRRLYSQAGQDLWVMRDVFGYRTGGYFVEIGAAEGTELSNTFALERYLQWNGVCIEPDPAAFERLRHNRRCRCLNICLDAQKGEVDFTIGEGFYGGIVAPDTDNSSADRGNIRVAATTFAELIDEQDIPRTIDYLSIDVEGAEDRVMATFPFRTHRFLAATIERPSPELRRTLSSHGYCLVAELPNLDCFYLHPDVCPSYNLRACLAAHQRALPPAKRLAAGISWVLRNGVRAALGRM